MPHPVRPSIEPMPPAALGGLPWIGAGLRLLRDPTRFMATTRAALGDTFVVDGERCASESIRLAQRSITLRRVVEPLAFADERTTYRLAPGVLVTTMLSVTNTTAAPGLDGFDPAHYEGRRLAPTVPLVTKELVSTFGHGLHACPAQRFAIAAIRVAACGLLDRYDVTPEFTTAEPRARQLGAVARAAAPCVVRYRARDRR